MSVPHQPFVDQVSRSIQQWEATDPEIDVSALDIFGRIHRTYLLYNAQLSAVFGAHGLNAASFGVLAALYRAGEPYRLTVSELVEESLISSGGMTMRLDRLEQASLITRVRDSSDRRVVFACLTAEGVTTAQTVARAHFANEKRLLHMFGGDQRAELANLLRLLEMSMQQAADQEVSAEAGAKR